jgi:hypothetical protein
MCFYGPLEPYFDRSWKLGDVTAALNFGLTAATAATVATANGGGDSDEPICHCDSIWCWPGRPRQFAYCPAWQYSRAEACW